MNIIKLSFKTFLFTIIFTFGSVGLYAQHLFSVAYNGLSQENVTQIRTQVTNSVAPASTIPMTRSGNNREDYSFSLQSVQNTKIIILNEETGNNVVIIPTEEAPAEFQLPPFFIEELRLAVLGNADRFLVVETDTDLSVRNVASVSTTNLSVRNAAAEQVFIPRYFYGQKENVKEALPKDRQIIHIFKQKPNVIPAFPNDPENLRYVAQLEEEMSYLVYMYVLPDSTLTIFDEHFIKPAERNATSTGTNLEFNLSGNLTGEAETATLYALDIWSDELIGTIPVDISVTFTNMGSGVLGASYGVQHFRIDEGDTFFPSALANQLSGFNRAPSSVDILLQLNSHSSINWYFPATGSSGSRTDWITVMLHEVTHGLGFAAMINQNGAYSYGLPCIFTRQLYQGLTDGNITTLTQQQRRDLIVSNNLFAGSSESYLLDANGGARVKMYVPTTYAPGSSVSHWDYSVTFPTFMRYAYTSKLHTINEREIALMQDMGWLTPASIATALEITTTTVPDGTVNTYYSHALRANPRANLTWSIQTGSLPTGLSLAAGSGVISGAPTTEGTFNFTVQAANSFGSDSKVFSIDIAPKPKTMYIIGNNSVVFKTVITEIDSIIFYKPEGITIDGIVWATHNVNTSGTFTANSTDAGMLYQWNRNTGWSATDPIINSDGDTVWDSSDAEGTEWEKVNDPCPQGWRVPTSSELNSLKNSGSIWTTVNGIDGRIFGTAPKQIFLPVAGGRNSTGMLGNASTTGYYWSSMQGSSTSANSLSFTNSRADVSSGNRRASGFSVRCVLDNSVNSNSYKLSTDFEQEPDTMYIMKNGGTLFEYPVAEIDSIVYYIPIIPEEGVLIDSIRWATRNVDMPGTFAATSGDAGMFYQWNRRVGWSFTDPMINSNGNTIWNSSNAEGTEWEKTNDPCPEGWRVPTISELESLLDSDSTWITQNGVNGRRFGTAPNQIFLPAAGWHYDSELSNVNEVSCYWSSTQNNSIAGAAWYLYFHDNIADIYSAARACGLSVRCVKE